jgi:hypothetical protein
MAAFLRLSLPSATGILAVATIGGVVGLYEIHFHVYALAALVPVLVVAVIYLRAYSERPLVVRPARPSPPAAPPSTGTPAPPSGPGSPAVPPTPESPPPPPEPIDESEPFDDPVEEADRLESTPSPAGPGE